MTQYLLSVHLDEAPPAPSDEQMQQNYKAVDAFNQELRAAGAWVFAGGLNPPSTASVVRAQGGQAVTTDGPTPRPRNSSAAITSSTSPTWTRR